MAFGMVQLNPEKHVSHYKRMVQMQKVVTDLVPNLGTCMPEAGANR